jgi:hypothetical protein
MKRDLNVSGHVNQPRVIWIRGYSSFYTQKKKRLRTNMRTCRGRLENVLCLFPFFFQRHRALWRCPTPTQPQAPWALAALCVFIYSGYGVIGVRASLLLHFSRSTCRRATDRGPSCAEGDRAGLRSGRRAARSVDRVHGPPVVKRFLLGYRRAVWNGVGADLVHRCLVVGTSYCAAQDERYLIISSVGWWRGQSMLSSKRLVVVVVHS